MQLPKQRRARPVRRLGVPLSSTKQIKQNPRTDSKRLHAKKFQIKQHAQRAYNLHDRLSESCPRDKSPSRSSAARIRQVKAMRERWAAIAEETQRIVLGDGKYVEERIFPAASSAVAQSYVEGSASVDSLINRMQGLQVRKAQKTHDISAQVQLSRQGTIFHNHYSDALAQWATARKRVSHPPSQTTLDFVHQSTLTAARQQAQLSDSDSPKIGILSHASRKKPGGGCLHGGDEQEETLARHSSLVASLNTPAGQEFYREHRKYWTEDGSGLHDHSMVYSPGVVVFRADGNDTDVNLGDPAGGAFIAPYQVDVVSAVPVNAAAVRAKHIILPAERQFFEDGIRSAMKERMARALRVFEEKGDEVLVLGAFGCGSSQNNVDVIASIWAELLVCGDRDGSSNSPARFKDVFKRVIFAVPGKLFASFRKAFEMRVFEEEVDLAVSSDDK
ncbi:hypothetical protein QCA50_005123 [Cerrena zonata]|uniref:Microbial-type PARG catalytic domain-containing protein n=1 Tax=Cerrena zonata TaxID=2478898 RepID=A0AAW0GE22_9APHY